MTPTEAMKLAEDYRNYQTSEYNALIAPLGVLARAYLSLIAKLAPEVLVSLIAMPAVLKFPNTFKHEYEDAMERAQAIRAHCGLESEVKP